MEQKPPRVPFGNLIEKGWLKPGDKLYSKDGNYEAEIQADTSFFYKDVEGSLYKVSAAILHKQSNNGWKFWHANLNGKKVLIDELRSQYIERYLAESAKAQDEGH